MKTNPRNWPAHAVGAWPDDAGAPRTRCAKCDAEFGTVARAPDGRRSGRDRCPVCAAQLPIPDALHETYVQWNGLAAQAAARGVRLGLPAELAHDTARDLYNEAIRRWVPAVAAFSTFATYHLRHGIDRALAAYRKRGYRPHEVQAPRLPDWQSASYTTDTYQWTPEPFGGPDDAPGPGEIAEAADQAAGGAEAVRAALDRLPLNLRRVLELRHGFGGETPMTLEAIGARLGITRERVRQLEANAEKLVRDFLSTKRGLSNGQAL